MKTIEVVRKEMDNYIKEGRTSAFGGGTKLPLDTSEVDGVLTGNYQNILYTKKGEDKVLTLGEFKCGKITDTSPVDPNDTRLVKGTKIKVSVEEISGQMRNTIKFV